MGLSERRTAPPITVERCDICGCFKPVRLSYGAKIVAASCAHRAWREVRYVEAPSRGQPVSLR